MSPQSCSHLRKLLALVWHWTHPEKLNTTTHVCHQRWYGWYGVRTWVLEMLKHPRVSTMQPSLGTTQNYPSAEMAKSILGNSPEATNVSFAYLLECLVGPKEPRSSCSARDVGGWTYSGCRLGRFWLTVHQPCDPSQARSRPTVSTVKILLIKVQFLP